MSSSGGEGGFAARRAILRWSLRMFRREWRQQVLITVLVAVAVAVTILGAGVISGAQVPPNAQFGSANQMAQLSGSDPHLGPELAALRRHFGAVSVIQSVTLTTGTVHGAQLEALDPHARFVGPLVQLTRGRYPTAPGELDLSSALAQIYGVGIGGSVVANDQHWRVVGEVESPTDLNVPFALAAPGAISHPSSIAALFDGTPGQLSTFSPPKSIYNTLISSISEPIPPSGVNIGELLVLIGATFGMLFIGLIAVAGFTVMARRRTRAIGMLGALGAPESKVRLALLVNGLAVGTIAMLLGGAVGLGAWFAYAPHQQASVGHVVDPAGIAWWLVIVAMLLAPITTTLAALRPARTISRMPVVAALSGRPTEPQVSRRNAAIGVAVLFGGVLVTFAGGSAAGRGGGGAFVVLFGIVAACVGLFLVAQWIVAQLGRVAGRLPISAKVALRDLARYRSRSGAALGAICLALLVTGVVVLAATARYSDPFDWVGPNVAPNVVIVYPAGNYTGAGSQQVTQCGPSGCKNVTIGGPGSMTRSQFSAMAQRIATAIGATSSVPLEVPSAGINRTTPGRNFNGQVYVATPALLAHYGIAESSIDPRALILTSRPGLPGAAGQLSIVNQSQQGPNNFNNPCPPGYCVLDPQVEEVSKLPTGTSAPNTVLTEYAMKTLHLTMSPQAYLVTVPRTLTASQKQTARSIAGSAQASIETANSFASLNEVLSWSIGAGLLLALGVLAMTVGLIRAETASELRVLTAAGASRRTRRALTSITAAALGFIGAALGLIVAYLEVGAFLANNFSNNVSELTYNVPIRPLGVMLLGLPLIAGLGGWVFAGREPAGIGRQPIE